MAQDYVKIYQRVIDGSGRARSTAPRHNGAIVPRRDQVVADQAKANGATLAAAGSAANLRISFR
jgi:hypothetical protein